MNKVNDAINSFFVRRWHAANLKLIRQLYPDAIMDRLGFEWLVIPEFELPKVYNQKNAFFRMDMPGLNIHNHEGYNFYVSKGLTRPDLESFEHIFNEKYNIHANKGLCWLSLHIKSFKPSLSNINSGDTLLSLIQNVYNFLALKKGL